MVRPKAMPGPKGSKQPHFNIPHRNGSFFTCLFLEQSRSGGLFHLKTSNLRYFLSSLPSHPALPFQPLTALMLFIPVEMSTLKGKSVPDTYPNMTVRPLAPSPGTPGSLTSVPARGGEALCPGKGFQAFLHNRETRECDGDLSCSPYR